MNSRRVQTYYPKLYPQHQRSSDDHLDGQVKFPSFNTFLSPHRMLSPNGTYTNTSRSVSKQGNNVDIYSPEFYDMVMKNKNNNVKNSKRKNVHDELVRIWCE